MKVDVANVNETERRITVSIPFKSVDRKIDKAYLDLKKNVKLKGFRPGKAPVSILQRHFKSHVEEEVTSQLVKDTYPKALEEIKAAPISQPRIENGVLEKGKDFSYTAIFEIKPEIDIKDYKGLELERKKVEELNDEEIEGEIETLRNNFAEMKDVAGRTTQKGDYVVLDFDGTVNQVPYPGGHKKNFFMEIKADAFLPRFSEQLTGLQKDSEKTFTLAIPDNYTNKDIAGKTVEFKVLIKEIKEKLLPEVDDEFAKDLGDYTGLDDLKEKLREAGIQKKRLDAEALLKDKIFDILIEKNPFDVPKAMVENQARNMILNTQQMLEAQGLKIEDMGQSAGQLFEQYGKPAERQVRTALLLEAVAAAEALAAEERDFETEYQKLAEQSKQDVASIKAKVDREILRSHILERRAIELIIANAKITEK